MQEGWVKEGQGQAGSCQELQGALFQLAASTQQAGSQPQRRASPCMHKTSHPLPHEIGRWVAAGSRLTSPPPAPGPLPAPSSSAAAAPPPTSWRSEQSQSHPQGPPAHWCSRGVEWHTVRQALGKIVCFV